MAWGSKLWASMVMTGQTTVRNYSAWCGKQDVLHWNLATLQCQLSSSRTKGLMTSTNSNALLDGSCYDLSLCQWCLSIFFALSNSSFLWYVHLQLNTLLTSFWFSKYLFHQVATPHCSFLLSPERWFPITHLSLLVCSYLRTAFIILSNSLILATCSCLLFTFLLVP